MVADLCHVVQACFRGENAKGRLAKTRQNHHFSAWPKHDRQKPKIWWLICAMPYYRVFGAKRRKGATRQPAKWLLFFVFSRDDLSPRHPKERHFSFVAVSPPVCRIFGEAKGRHAKTRQNHHLVSCFCLTFLK